MYNLNASLNDQSLGLSRILAEFVDLVDARKWAKAWRLLTKMDVFCETIASQWDKDRPRYAHPWSTRIANVICSSPDARACLLIHSRRQAKKKVWEAASLEQYLQEQPIAARLHDWLLKIKEKSHKTVGDLMRELRKLPKSALIWTDAGHQQMRPGFVLTVKELSDCAAVMVR